MTFTTASLALIARTREEALREVEQMSVDDRRQVAPEWLAKVRGSSGCDPWLHGFVMTLRGESKSIGRCGYTGPPGPDGVVEIAYGVDPEYQGKGYATEAAMGLLGFAFRDPGVRAIRAHTLPQENASTRVLTKCGFRRVGESIDHEAGVVWQWEKHRAVA